MDTQQKKAIAGASMVAAGVGLTAVGLAFIAPAAISWAARMVEKGSERLGVEMEGASRKVGAAVGTLRRSLNQAAKAGLAEMKRNS